MLLRNLSQPRQHCVLDALPHSTTAQQEGINNKRIRMHSEDSHANKTVVSKAIRYTYDQALRGVGLTELSDFRFRSPNGREIELICPEGELRHPSDFRVT